MKLKTRLLILAGSMGFITLLSSCQTAATGASGSAGASGSEAVMCDKCKTVWVRQPLNIGSPGRFQTTIYRDTKTMTCPECQLSIDNYWRTGQMKPTCSHCGGTRTCCTVH